MSFNLVSNTIIRKKLILELEKGHFQVAVIGGVLQLPWTIWESLFAGEFWLPLLYMRIFTSVLPVLLFFTYKKAKISSSLCLLLLVMSISFTSFYGISNMEIQEFRMYTFGIITFFLSTGMLVTWEMRYSIAYLILSILLSILLFYLNSPLTISEILSNGGFAFYTIGIFSVVIIYMRYRYRFNDLKTRTEMANFVDELNEKTLENKVLYDELQLIDKSAIVAEMTSSVAHELNTPISVLKNSSAIMVESFHEVLKLPNEGVNWTHVNYILLKLSDRQMFTSYFKKIQESERIESYLKELELQVSEEHIHLLASSGLVREDKELLDLIFNNRDYLVIIQLIYQLRIIHVMNENISTSVRKTADIIHEMRSIQLQTNEGELSVTNLKLTFEKAVSLFEFQTNHPITFNVTIDDDLEILTSKFKLIQLWVKLFEFIALSKENDSTEKNLQIEAAIEDSTIAISFHLSGEHVLNYGLLNNVNSIFRQAVTNQIDPFNLNILRTLISDFKLGIKVVDNALVVLIPNH
jgi:signal transduction histidine kinase